MVNRRDVTMRLAAAPLTAAARSFVLPMLLLAATLGASVWPSPG